MEEGDANTKFFHASATSKKKTNYISWLQTDAGDRVESHEGMCRIIQDYYQAIFKASPEVRMEDSTPQTRVSVEQNSMLVQEITFKKFSIAVKQMHPDKASMLDGFNLPFFQQCCKEWLSISSFLADINNTNLVLIPQKTGANNMKDFRPIAICNM